MNTCFSICIPEEIWLMIIGSSGLVFQQLFMINKRLNMYLDKIKNNFIKVCAIHDTDNTIIETNNTCGIKFNVIRNIENTKIITVIKNNNVCIIKYDGKTYFINANFCDIVEFMIDEELEILMASDTKVILSMTPI